MQKPAIRQEDVMGCGVACVAFVLGKSYASAKKLFRKPENAMLRGFFCKELIAALGKAGKDYKLKYVKNPLKWDEGMIVFIRRSKTHPFGHYLAKAKRGWMDPWINWGKVDAKAGMRKRLPGKPLYVIVPL